MSFTLLVTNDFSYAISVMHQIEFNRLVDFLIV